MSQCLINFTFLSLNCHGLLALSSLSSDSPEFTMFDTFDTQAGTVVHISLRLPCNYLHSTYGHILQHTSMIQWYRLLCVSCVRCHVQTAVFSAWSDDRCHGLRSQCLKPSQLGVHFMHFFHAMIRHENHVMSFHTHPHVSWLLNWAQIAPSLLSGSHTILAGALNGAPCFAFGISKVFCSAWQIHWLNHCPIAYCKNWVHSLRACSFGLSKSFWGGCLGIGENVRIICLKRVVVHDGQGLQKSIIRPVSISSYSSQMIRWNNGKWWTK